MFCIKFIFYSAHRAMWSVTNYFLVNLTLADLLMSTLNCIPSFLFMRDRCVHCDHWFLSAIDLLCVGFGNLVPSTVASTTLSPTSLSLPVFSPCLPLVLIEEEPLFIPFYRSLVVTVSSSLSCSSGFWVLFFPLQPLYSRRLSRSTGICYGRNSCTYMMDILHIVHGFNLIKLKIFVFRCSPSVACILVWPDGYQGSSMIDYM